MHLVSIKKARALIREQDFTGPQLREAIPYINSFSGKKFVLKIGGSVLNDVLNDSTLLPSLIDDVIFLKKVGINVVLVHGGSRQLNDAMKEKNLKVESINGLRATSAEVLEMAADVFCKISHQIKKEVEKNGYKCVIFSRDSGLVKSKQVDDVRLGYVGDPQVVETSLLEGLAENVIPVVSSVTAGTTSADIGFNVNADDVAGIIASAIKAEKVILMTDVDGVLDEHGHLLSTLTVSQAEELIRKKVIHGGMIPKVLTCLNALKRGAKKCHIIRGSAHSFIDEILTDKGVGTEFVSDKLINREVV